MQAQEAIKKAKKKKKKKSKKVAGSAQASDEDEIEKEASAAVSTAASSRAVSTDGDLPAPLGASQALAASLEVQRALTKAPPAPGMPCVNSAALPKEACRPVLWATAVLCPEWLCTAAVHAVQHSNSPP